MVLDTEMNKIAFDLDGVFISDCDQMPQIGGLTEFYALAYHMRPLFKPSGDWNIVTGRDPKYRAQTMSWIDNHFENKPKRVWHEIGDTQSPEEYKAEIINQNNIDFFVESDLKQVKYLKQNVSDRCTVIHFSDFISKQIRQD